MSIPALAMNLGTAFTYQGQLKSGGNAVNSSCDFQFGLWDAASGGVQIGSTQPASSVPVTNGLFTVQIDFGSGVFNGDARWLEIAVRCPTASGVYTGLSPRQALTPALYALALPGLYTQQNGLSPNLIGGYSGNSVTPFVVGATIGGGGNSGFTNRVTDLYGTVSGGLNNQAGDNAGTTSDKVYATVGGGYNNIASGGTATVGGGTINTASGGSATVGGGYHNTASGDDAIVGGGFQNTASGIVATVGGGDLNTASGNYATVGGGYGNNASNLYATVAGGYLNTASGTYSFAAGNRANAAHDGSFVWADGYNVPFASTLTNQFNVRATGGVRLVLAIDGSGNPTWTCSVVNGGSWSCSSDRNLKENLSAVDGRAILQRLSRVPLFTWNAKGTDPNVKHLGPTAQDFYAAFNLGEDDRHISTIDAEGVALAAIQGLNQVVQEKDAEIQNLKTQNAKLETQNAALELRVSVLEKQNADVQARLTALEQALQAGGGSQIPRSLAGMARSDSSSVPAVGLVLGGLTLVGLVLARRRSGGHG